MKDNRIVYIIDGPDGTGKSTLGKKLSEMFRIPIYHLTYFKDSKMHAAQFEKALELLRNSDTGFILDRYIFSEKVYSDVYRGGKYISIYDDCIKAIGYSNANVILTVPEDRERYKKMFDKLYEERQEMYSPEKIMSVYDGYNALLNKKWNFNVTRFDLFDIIDNESRNKTFEFDTTEEKYIVKDYE